MLSAEVELEIKYDVDTGFEVPSLTGLAMVLDKDAAVLEGDAASYPLEATYFDTADYRLVRAHLTVRRRTGGLDAGWHLKVPGPAGARREVRLPLGRAARTVPAALRRMVWVRARGAALVPVARITTDRRVTRLVDATGRVLLEVADDRVEACRLLSPEGAGEEAATCVSWREVEVELVHGDRRMLEAVDARMRGLGVEVAGSSSKLARVLGPDGAAPAAPKALNRLSPESSSGEVVLAYMAEQVEQVLAHDVQVRLDSSDSVHKTRVATRRLRSALQTFKPLFGGEAVRPLRAELKWLAAELGTARDAEVLRDRLAKAVDADSEHVSLDPAHHAVAGQMSQAYRTAHERLLKELDSDRYHRLIGALTEFVSAPSFTERAVRSAAKVLPARVARTYAVLRSEVGAAHDAPTDAERGHHLHEARKAAKRARYAGESVAGVFGKRAAAFAEAMEDVQEVLGEHQDSVVMRERLLELARQDTTPGAGFAYGRLHAKEEAAGLRSEERFEAVWKASSKKSLRRWLR